jgi:hypothetical protein
VQDDKEQYATSLSILGDGFVKWKPLGRSNGRLTQISVDRAQPDAGPSCDSGSTDRYICQFGTKIQVVEIALTVRRAQEASKSSGSHVLEKCHVVGLWRVSQEAKAATLS